MLTVAPSRERGQRMRGHDGASPLISVRLTQAETHKGDRHGSDRNRCCAVGGQLRNGEPVVMDRSSFPGDVTSVQAPGGRYNLRWIPQPSPAGQHELLLCDRSSGSETKLLAFPRGVAALWSPSGSRLSIGNHWGSDEATVLLWAALPGKPLDLLEDLAKQEHQIVARWNAHHLYLDPVAWASDTALDVHLWGYGDPNAPMLDRTYRYSLGRGFRRLRGMGAQPNKQERTRPAQAMKPRR
jgi:hypothetical protein